MLPPVISSELFDVRYKVSEMSLEHVCAKIEEFGFSVIEVRNLDLVIRITFGHGKDCGELRIDRLGKFFEICMVVDQETMMPASGDWDLVIEYLRASVGSRSIGM